MDGLDSYNIYDLRAQIQCQSKSPCWFNPDEEKKATTKQNKWNYVYLKTIKRRTWEGRRMVIKTVQRWSYNRRTSHPNLRLHNRIRYARNNICVSEQMDKCAYAGNCNDAIKIRLKFHTPKHRKQNKKHNIMKHKHTPFKWSLRMMHIPLDT